MTGTYIFLSPVEKVMVNTRTSETVIRKTVGVHLYYVETLSTSGKGHLYKRGSTKLHNEEELTTFANQAYSKLLKNLQEKPNEVPEELFNFNLDTEKAKGKRIRVPTDKIKESKEQDEEMSPKKKKKNTENTKEKKQGLSPKKKKKPSYNTPAKERSEKKKIEETAAQKSAVYLSDVLTQFIDTDENEQHFSETIGPKPPSALGVSSSARNEELLDPRNQTSCQSLQCSPQPHLPAVQPLIPSSQPQVQSSTQPLLYSAPPPLLSTQPLLSSTQSSMPLPQHLQPMSLTNIPSTSMLETWSLCRQSMGASIEENSRKIPIPSTEVLHVLRGLQRADVQHFITKVVEHFESASCCHVGNDCFETSDNNTWAPNSEPYWGVEESEEPQSLSLPPLTPLRRSPRKRLHATMLSPSEDLQTREIPSSQKSPLRRSPRKNTTTTIPLSVGVADNSISSPGGSVEAIKKKASTNPSSSEKPRETDQDISSPGRAEGNGMVTLLKTYPGVLIKSENLQHAVRLARKSGKPGYTLCYNLLPGVFSIEEIAISRGQGLTKPKEGDLRRPLDKDKVAAIKGYALRWCKKNEKSEPKDQELNNAITEQVSHCRKKLKKEQQGRKI